MRSVETVLALVVFATLVAAFAKRLRVPAPSLLVVVGLVVGLLPGVPTVRVPPEAVSLVVLPPLLYAASEELSLRALRDVWRPVTVLAVGLVLASAGAVAAVAAAVTPLPVGLAFILGAVLASTDPVAVTALGRRLALPARLQALVQAESLCNDATSLVLFRIAVSFAVAGTAAGSVWLRAAGQFAVLAGGGAAIGACAGAGVMLVRSRISDPVLETVVALVTPYATYVLAETFHVSGVTAVIVAGLLLSEQLLHVTNAQTRLQLHSVYQTVIFLLESVVFGLIGLELPTFIRALARAGHAGPPWPLDALVITGTLLATRILWVFPLSAIAQRRRAGAAGTAAAPDPARGPRGRGPRRPAWQVPAVVSWAGARGVVPLAAALSIPLTTVSGAALPYRDLILVLATAVIAISLIVQGFTLGPLARFAGLARPPADAWRQEAMARLRLAEAGLARVDELASLEAVPAVVIDRLRHDLQARISRSRDRMEYGMTGDGLADSTYRRIRRDLIAVENTELGRLYAAGTVSEATRRRLQRTLDLEAAALGDE